MRGPSLDGPANQQAAPRPEQPSYILTPRPYLDAGGHDLPPGRCGRPDRARDRSAYASNSRSRYALSVRASGGSFSLQGISDRAALTYMDNHDRPTWQDLEQATSRPPACPKLRGLLDLLRVRISESRPDLR